MGTDLIEHLLADIGTLAVPQEAPKAPLTLEFVRNLGSADEAAAGQPLPTNGNALTRLRGAHHRLAKLLADGARDYDAAYATGYSASYISSLRKDPAFAELVTHYEQEVLAEYVDAHKQLATLGTTALEILQERLETEGDKMGVKTIKEIAEMALDRSIAPSKSAATAARGPSGSGVNVSVQFITPGKGQEPKTIEHEATVLVDTHPAQAPGTGTIE